MHLHALFAVSVVALTLLISGCSDATAPPQEQAPEVIGSFQTYPLPAPGHLEELARTITSVDYIFHKLPISMSLTDPNAIYTVMTHLGGAGAVRLDHGCKPIGRIFYLANGETVLTGDLYFSGECRFVVFVEDEKPAFAVHLHENGVIFLQNAGVPL